MNLNPSQFWISDEPESSKCDVSKLRSSKCRAGAHKQGQNPNAVNVGPELDIGPEPKSGAEALCSKCGPEPDAGPKPNAVNAGQKLDAGPKPNSVNAGLKPDAEPKPNAINAGPEPDAGPKPNVVNACSIRKCKKCKCKGGSALGPQLALPWRKGEDRGWSTRKGWHNSPVVRGGWPGWTTFGHSTSRHGEVKTAGGLPAKVGTIRLSCGVGGRDGRPLVIACLAMER
ncbi:hypothetical protein CDL15_Pgr024809 [Punica granatum]|uniref:Uncharacterized protein n=1 Tax=Punica granatum TaxID=22663 RepID=A0A218WIV2_PUNGR|nr:hypothetical protein CDL15_Pgr024809 [Punica granatum]